MANVIRLPRFRADQWRIAQHGAALKVVCNGRRWGKSVMGGNIAVTCAAAGGAVAWLAPTYKNSRPLFRFAEQAVAGVKSVKVNRAERVIEFPGGGWLGVYSGDNADSMRGEAFDVVIADEAARLTQEAYTDVIQPTLADRAGRCILISTPKGRNWFYREWLRALADGLHAAAFTAPTNANPMPTIRAAFERARVTVSERTFRQEWLAEFVEDGGGVFRNVRAATTVTAIDAAQPGRRYVMGVDWGRVNDATVIAVMDATTGRCVKLDRMTQTGYALQAGRLAALAERFEPDAILAEQNAMGGPLVELLQRQGLRVQGFVTTNASKARIIDSLALAFERGEIGIVDEPVLVAELEAYEAETLPGGLIRYRAPQGEHDDCVMALALGWHAVTYGGTAVTAAQPSELFDFTGLTVGAWG